MDKNFGNIFNRSKWTNNSNYGKNFKNKPEYTYRDEDTYDYIPSDDDIIKDEPLYTPKADSSPYQIGVLVSHPVFGNGKIIEKSGTNDDLKLVVLFENGQWKKLLARVAGLKLI